MEGNDLTNMISVLSSNPEIMGKISQLAKEMKTESKENSDDSREMIPDKRTEEQKNRERLISALKPYLNPERRAKADKLLSLIGVIELSKGSGIFK